MHISGTILDSMNRPAVGCDGGICDLWLTSLTLIKGQKELTCVGKVSCNRLVPEEQVLVQKGLDTHKKDFTVRPKLPCVKKW